MSKAIKDSIEARKIEICKAFNRKPKDGIEIIKKICGNDKSLHSQIASFFVDNKDNLDSVEVGDYLGTAGDKKKTQDGAEKHKTENEQVLECFMDQMQFKQKSFTDALREYLKAFKLPGEAQKIDRLMDAFGNAYVKQNIQSDIANKDAAYILAFQTIMLNTDLHNPSIPPEKKMSLESLKRNLQGTNDTKDFEAKFLGGIYNEIKSKAFEFAVKTPLSVEVGSNHLAADPAFMKYSAEAKKPWYSFLIGANVTSTIKDEVGGVVRMNISEPGLFGKILGKKPSLTIFPGASDKSEPLDVDLKAAAKISASFEGGIRVIPTYPYQTQEITSEYNKLKEAKNAGAALSKVAPKIETKINSKSNNKTSPPIKASPAIRTEEKKKQEKPKEKKRSKPEKKKRSNPVSQAKKSHAKREEEKRGNANTLSHRR